MNPESLAMELDRDPFLPLGIQLWDRRTVDILNRGFCLIANDPCTFSLPPRKAVGKTP
jgi:hypothetical protein